MLCRDGKAIDLSIDHKPEDDEERRRIEGAGGKVTADGRVNGGLNLSRALGQYHSHLPYIFRQKQDLKLSGIDILMISGYHILNFPLIFS